MKSQLLGTCVCVWPLRTRGPHTSAKATHTRARTPAAMPLASFEGRAYELPQVEPDWGLEVLLRNNPTGTLLAPEGPAEAMHAVLGGLAQGERAPHARAWSADATRCVGDLFAAAMYLTNLRWSCRASLDPPRHAPWGVAKAATDASQLLGTWLMSLTGYGESPRGRRPGSQWADLPFPLAVVLTGEAGVSFADRSAVSRSVYVAELQRYAHVCHDAVLYAAAMSPGKRALVQRVCDVLAVPGCCFLTVTCPTVQRSSGSVQHSVFPAFVVGAGDWLEKKLPPEQETADDAAVLEGELRAGGGGDGDAGAAAGEQHPGGGQGPQLGGASGGRA